MRGARRRIQELLAAGKQVKIIVVGKKGRDMLRRDQRDRIVEFFDGIVGKRRIEYRRRAAGHRAGARALRRRRVRRLHAGLQQVQVGGDADPHLPAAGAGPGRRRSRARGCGETSESGALYEFEPDEERILGELLPRNLAVQLFGALLENAASEQGARMAAMDSATRNAGEMINKLTLSYNRQRQAQITKELMEIISGAEAL